MFARAVVLCAIAATGRSQGCPLVGRRHFVLIVCFVVLVVLKEVKRPGALVPLGGGEGQGDGGQPQRVFLGEEEAFVCRRPGRQRHLLWVFFLAVTLLHWLFRLFW